VRAPARWAELRPCDREAAFAHAHASSVCACPRLAHAWYSMNPAYTFPNTVLESKRVLRSMMSEEESLDVMSRNPAVLQYERPAPSPCSLT
jgi:hypothetical protein